MEYRSFADKLGIFNDFVYEPFCNVCKLFDNKTPVETIEKDPSYITVCRRFQMLKEMSALRLNERYGYYKQSCVHITDKIIAEMFFVVDDYNAQRQIVLNYGISDSIEVNIESIRVMRDLFRSMLSDMYRKLFDKNRDY